jgi:hypothetical protein
MFAAPSTNPWAEAEAPQVWRAIAVLATSRARCADLFSFFPTQKKAIDAFAADLEYLEAAYRADVRSYRETRALTAVHLPALFECLDVMAAETDVSSPEVEQTLGLAFKLASDSRKAVSAAKLDSAKVTLASIEETAGSVAAEPQAPRGWMSSLADGVQGVALGTLNPVIASVGTGYSKITRDAGRRLTGLSSYATTAATGLVDDAVSLVLSPVNTHLGALRSAAWTAAGSMALDSVLIAVLFPPALPLAVGAGILEGTASYSDHLEQERKKENSRRRAIRSERDEKSKQALDRIMGRSPVVSLSSPHVYVTIDTDQNTATGTILSGKFIGQQLNDLHPSDIKAMISHAPDQDTGKILQSWQRRLNLAA